MITNRSFSFAKHYSTYFLKGTDPRPLNPDQQFQISEFVSQDPEANSFFVYNSQQIKNKLKQWNQSLPWIKPYYSIKANPIKPLVTQLIKNGTGMSCTSRAELKMSLEYGLRHIGVFYSNPVKDEVDLKWASDNGIILTVADSIEELHKIKQLAPKMKVLWRIAIPQISDGIIVGSSSKFGDQIFTDEQITQKMKQIKEIGVNLMGIHFHCNQSQHSSETHQRTILHAQNCMKIGRKLGHRMEILNVGGAFNQDRITKEAVSDLELVKNDPLGYQVIAEPGRYFCSNSCYLLTRVLAKRVKSDKPCYQINDSLYHAFNCILLDGVSFQNKEDVFYSKVIGVTDPGVSGSKKKPKISDSVQKVGKTKQSTVFGMTCDGLDIIARNFYVPESVQVGDWLCFSGMGAYTYGPRTTFNGMKSIQKIIHWCSNIEQPPKGQ